MIGPQVPLSESIHAEKYRGPGEDFRGAMNRVAGALADSPEHYHEFRETLLDMRFLPGGRIQASAGAAKRTTMYNCFVSGTIQDSFVEGPGSIMDRAKEAATTLRMGGGIGYDFSTLRPRGARIKKLNSSATGPVSFMRIFDSVCQCVASSGHRRGAQMGVLRIDHPDVLEFVRAKNELGQLEGFNMSLAVTDEFMECLGTGRAFTLRFKGEDYGEVDPEALWEEVMRSTWDWAEPGVLFIDAINRDNNLRYCETIAATNPCGEQPLPPFGACLLGSFNLVRYLRKSGETSYFDWDQLGHDIPHVVRAMDNVVDKSIYPMHEQWEEAKNKRRMGLGVTGLANAAEVLGMPYGSPRFLKFEADVLDRIARDSYLASAKLAAEKGAFPLYDSEQFLSIGEGGPTFFQRRFDDDDEVLALVGQYGLRNSHLTSIAPTGTISLTADNVSSGIEPPFLLEYERKVNMPEGQITEVVQDYAARVYGVRGRTTADVTVQQHLDVLVCAARRVDSAVSKTCNLPGSTAWEDFKAIYRQAWQAGAKGCTTFNPNGKRLGVLLESREPTGGSCEIGPDGKRDCA